MMVHTATTTNKLSATTATTMKATTTTTATTATTVTTTTAIMTTVTTAPTKTIAATAMLMVHNIAHIKVTWKTSLARSIFGSWKCNLLMLL